MSPLPSGLQSRSADSFASNTDAFNQYLESLGLKPQDDVAVSESSVFSIARRSLGFLAPTYDASSFALSPRDINILSRDAVPAPSDNPPKSSGIDPSNISNQGILALFALLSAALVLASIWFFFWARNGGFHFQEGDWDDYKSTVLRRKGPNGTTLSNATKSTDLGMGSVRDGEFDRREEEEEEVGVRQKSKRVRGHTDEDVRAYRHEKPARVGGLNRQADGSHYEHTNTDRSDVSSEQAAATTHNPSREKGTARATSKRSFFHRAPRIVEEPEPRRPSNAKAHRQPSTTYSFTNGDDNSTLPDSTYTPRRAHRSARRHYAPAAQRASPRKAPSLEEEEQSYRDEDEETTADTAETGTKVYRHNIPGLRSGGASRPETEVSFSDAAGRSARGGYRRAGGRRRDSLSDSDLEG
ncbi:MAG: hypothetical protein M1829_001584 [Trizodia sp. TS-e1964]|nr:MAG: hypothetical protein M1829_001584 [Trizodia sp. TS-e1964]